MADEEFGTTDNYDLPFPTGKANPDIPRDVKNLADKVDEKLGGKQDSGNYQPAGSYLTNGGTGNLKLDNNGTRAANWVASTGGRFSGKVFFDNTMYAAGGGGYPFWSSPNPCFDKFGYVPDGYDGIFFYGRTSGARHFLPSHAARSVEEAQDIIESPTVYTKQSRLIDDQGELDEEPQVYVDSMKTIEHLAEIVEAQTNVIAALTNAGRKSTEAASAVAALQELMNKDTHEIVPDAEPLEGRE